MQDYRNLAADVVAELKRNGADAADAYVVTYSNFSTEIRLGRIEKLEQSIGKGLGMRVFKDGATAVTYTTDFADKSVKNVARDAMEIVKVSNADEFNGLAPKEALGSYAGKLALYDEAIAKIPTEKKVEMAREAEAAGMKVDKRITNSDGSSWSDGATQITLANSDGFVGQFQTTGASLSLSLIAEENGVKQTDFWYTYGRMAKGLDSPTAVGEEAGRRVVSKLGAKKVKSQSAPVILDPSVGRRLLGMIFNAASGRSIYRKSSFLVDQLGKEIASPLVTIVDDATLAIGPSSRPFDGEGVKTGAVTVVEKGVLKGYMCDSYSARRLKLPLTGTTSRSWQGGPGVSSSNLYLAGGDKSPEEIMKSVKSGLYLRTLSSQGANFVTGDFSHGASGYWIENGEIAHPVQEITVAGNFLTLLKNIVAVGNDGSWKFGGTNSPTILVSEMTIGGA
jgi:PmbA protein